MLPPDERRGLVLIDPPYEAADESKRVVERRWRARWRNGRAESTCCGGRSRTGATTRASSTRFAAIGAPDILASGVRCRRASRRRANSPAPLARAGLLVVNPPLVLIDEARALLP